MKAHSITRRVASVVLAAELAATVALSILIFVHEERTQLRALDVATRGRADSLLGAVQDLEDQGDHVFVDPTELRLPSEDRWKVFNTNGTLVGRSSSVADSSLLLQRNDGVYDQKIDGLRYRVVQYHAVRVIDREETGGAGIRRPVILLYATPETRLLHESFESASFYILAAALISALTAAGVAISLRISLKPVTELAHAAERLTLPGLNFVAPRSVESISELQPLARTLTTVVVKLREAFQREKRFAGDAAHELKTAIAVLRSTIQVLMLRSRTPEEHQAGLQRALEDTQRLETIVLQLLSLARTEEKRHTGEDTADLAAAVEAAVSVLSPLSSHSNVSVISSLQSGSPVSMLQGEAEVLVTNLVSNAIQHSPPQSTVHVAVEVTQKAVLLTVQDRGVGIASEALPHIFERFYRVDPSRSRETGGTGLGLAICKAIVDRAGGAIEVKSQLGQGTKIIATFISS